MAAGDLIDGPWQVEVGSTLIGDGQTWEPRSYDGGFGTPPMRTSDTDRPLDHGQFAGLDLYGSRTLVISAFSHATSASVLQSRVDDLTTTLQASTGTVTIAFSTSDDTPYLLFGRPRRVDVRWDDAPAAKLVRVTFEFVAHDPRRYGATLKSQNVTLPTSAGGFTFPLTFPLAFGGATSSSVTVTNAGNFGTRPTWTLNGPLTNPRLESVTAGETLELAISLSSGETLVVDFDEKTVLLDGTASRYSTVVDASWWELSPGDNEIRLGADSGSGDADVTFRDAWI